MFQRQRSKSKPYKVQEETMNFIIDSPINAMAVSSDGANLAVAGRSLLKVYSLNNEDSLFGFERFNLRSSNLKNLNFSNSDVTWCPNSNAILATAATNGAVVVWNLENQSIKSKIDTVFNDHRRTVNKVCFHSEYHELLLSGSQDGCIKMFDLRMNGVTANYVSNSESVRDVQFSPAGFSTSHFAAVQETGNVEIWDTRRPDKPENSFIGHDGPVFSCEWHPNQSEHKFLATGGRDKTIKIWDLHSRSKPVLAYQVHSIAPVSKLKWRPDNDMHIGSCSLVVDYFIYVWDITRPYVPYAIFGTRKDVTTGVAWKNNPYVFISSCKDGTIYQHTFAKDAYYPAECSSPQAISINGAGDMVFASSDFIIRYSQHLSASSYNKNSNSCNNNNNLQLQQRLTKANSLGANASLTPVIGIFNSSNSQQQSLSSSLTGPPPPPSDFKKNLISLAHVSNYFGGNAHQTQSSDSTPPNGLYLEQKMKLVAESIDGPISYRRSPPIVLNEHFRCMKSHVRMYLSKEMTTDTSSNNQNYLSMRHFVDFARRYHLSEVPFEEMCEHNAQLAESQGYHQIAQTWRIVRHMFSIAGRHPTSSGGAGNNPSGGSLPNMPFTNEPQVSVEFKMKGDNPSRHTSGGTRHMSGTNANIVANQVINPGMLQANQNNITLKPDGSSDEEEMRDNFDNFTQKMKSFARNTIPSNKFAVDFFEFSQLESEVDGFQSELKNHRFEPHFHHDFDASSQEWELQRESIMHRHNIADIPVLCEFNNAQNTTGDLLIGGANCDVSSPISFDDDDEIGPADEALGLFDANLQSLLHSKNPSPPSWPFLDIVTDLLRHYVNAGDVQTAVTIILVLGDKMKQITSIDKADVRMWFRNYIDLLNRFQLWDVSCRVIQLSTDSEIQAINQSGTTVRVHCGKCRKLIKHGSVCDRCIMRPNKCSICHVAVRGLFSWCQGCAHGGHLQHMIKWFSHNSLCPAGCGHHCEMC